GVEERAADAHVLEQRLALRRVARQLFGQNFDRDRLAAPSVLGAPHRRTTHPLHQSVREQSTARGERVDWGHGGIILTLAVRRWPLTVMQITPAPRAPDPLRSPRCHPA